MVKDHPETATIAPYKVEKNDLSSNAIKSNQVYCRRPKVMPLTVYNVVHIFLLHLLVPHAISITPHLLADVENMLWLQDAKQFKGNHGNVEWEFSPTSVSRAMLRFIFWFASFTRLLPHINQNETAFSMVSIERMIRPWIFINRTLTAPPLLRLRRETKY